MRITSAALMLTAALLAASTGGCETTAVNKDSHSTLLNSDDMVTMTNKMATSMIADQRIQRAWQSGSLKIVIKPVTNFTNVIIPDTDAELYVVRLQALLSKQPQLADRFVWCVNREDYDKLRAQEIPEANTAVPEGRITPEYALYAEFQGDTRVGRNTRSDTYLCVYKLTRISGGRDGEILWSDSYERSKSAKRGILD